MDARSAHMDVSAKFGPGGSTPSPNAECPFWAMGLPPSSQTTNHIGLIARWQHSAHLFGVCYGFDPDFGPGRGLQGRPGPGDYAE